MDFAYRIDKAKRIVYLEGDDPSFEVWQQTMLAVFADPEFVTGYNFLSDRRSATRARSSEYLKTALDFLKSHADEIGSCKWATVISTLMAFGMGRMTQTLSKDSSIRIELFKDINQAVYWLMQDEVEQAE
jgi:hypothetical protein